ncbi:STAS domain-containing protein [Microbispora sp. RL4-1S]|uniref:STAS domain-containing protein n=1 Tax=Microbispora oryzae TaxID=2806554 RepID=A0A940WSL2_9ACTN|nr:STAS domain-containing protein [Microbispora oryzae]MBP2708648.1 STAS domain-containing protein [Microbispora oryzae]
MMTIKRSFESTAPLDLLYADTQISVRSIADGSVRLVGQIDLTNGDAVADALAGRRRSTVIVMDVAELNFIDLYGLRILALLSEDPRDRPVELRNPRPSLVRLLQLLSWPTFTLV